MRSWATDSGRCQDASLLLYMQSRRIGTVSLPRSVTAIVYPLPVRRVHTQLPGQRAPPPAARARCSCQTGREHRPAGRVPPPRARRRDEL